MRWDKILYKRSVVSYLLYPFSLLFSGILLIRRLCYKTGLLKVYTPKVKTISVGNIVCGGSGKTPFTIFLAGLLRNEGYKVAVSHRGYKGKFEHTNRIISDVQGLREEAEEAGDEPQLLAEKLSGIPVITGKNRAESIRILQQNFPDLDYIILDDSFQHLKVKKSFDFVLFNSAARFSNYFVLPAGLLREPLNSLSRADCIIYNGNDTIPEQLIRTGKKIIRMTYRIRRLYFPDGQEVEPDVLKHKRLALISGIGHPESFEKTLKNFGISFEKHYCFPDHYNYKNKKTVERLADEIGKNYDFALTTEKDYTKLKKYHELLPLVIVSVEIHSESKDEILRLLE